MFSAAEKTSHYATAVQQKTAAQTFFRKAGEESFFGAKEKSSFFGNPIQTKLSVSSPDDPQEKEADAVAEQVMRMPDPATPIREEKQEKLQREEMKEEKKEKEKVQPKLMAGDIPIHRKCEACENEEKAQAKPFRMIQRSEDASSTVDIAEEETHADRKIDRKHISLYHSDVIQRSGRGPPGGFMQFEQSLSSSKGQGSALPASTQQFMESRFNADFSGVRIHTGSYAENLSSNIHARAFTHGNDVYFNNGKYSPDTADGSLLLAHELTHTIQQGASKTNSINTTPNTSVSRKNIVQRSPDNIPPQLNNAVEKAKTVEGKINANKEGADGFREGWQHLVEIFKTTMGEDKVISSSGGSAVQGAISEADIKKKRIVTGKPPANPRPSTNGPYERDAMPSWCGIFVFWALNKSGVPMRKWELGGRNIKPEAAYAPGYIPHAGDIAYRDAFSHFAIVESATGGTVKSVNGNTAGEDNLGGQVQTREHPLSDWTAFFNPLKLMSGSLGSGEGPVEKPKTLKELRKELFKVNRKEEGDHEEESTNEENNVQPKTELSNWNVDAGGHLQTVDHHHSLNKNDEKVHLKEEEKKEEEEKLGLMNPPSVQKKSAYDIHCKDECSCSEDAVVQKKHIAHPETENADSSLKAYNDIATSEQSVERDRGPPAVQSKWDSGSVIQRSVVDDALSFAGSVTDCISLDLDEAKRCALQKAQQVALHIPGYKALRVILGQDPITSENVDRNGRNFIEAAFDIMPGGSLLHQKLDEQHQLDAAAEWIDGKISEVESLVSGLFSAIETFWNGLGVSDFTSPMDVLRRGANIVFGFIDNVIDFAVNTAKELLRMVKDFLLSKIVEFIKEKTTAYPLLTVILGKDPITEQIVDRNGTNILNAMLELGGEEGRMQRDQMKDTGTFQKVAAYIDEGIAVFSGAYEEIIQGFKNIWDYVTIENLMNPIATFEKIYNEFAAPVRRVFDFVVKVAAEILRLVKDVLFRRISEEAKKVRGYFLVTVIINKDPFTGEIVPRTIENIIHGFMSLMEGGEEQYQQMKESGAIDQTTAKINAAVKKLNMTPQSIIQLFIDLWNSFTFSDFVHPIETFRRIIAKFGEPIARLVAFVVEIVKIVVEVILTIMNFPFDLINNIIAKAMKSFELIKRDPVGFLKNLLRAIKEGFIQFFDNIITHLINGLVGWLTMELKDSGVPELKDLSLKGIISWVLEILGISMEKIWEKLAAHPRIGPAKVAKIRSLINTLTGIWTFIKDVQERGVAAIWDKIQEQLSNLWNVVLDAVKNWIMEKIITQITVKLLSMLDPTGIMAVINSTIALYKAVQSFIKYLRQMLEIVNSFVEGVAEIASGNTKKAADFLERTLARGVPIVIGFLANQVGLTGIGKRIGEMIEKAREMVDKAITWLVNKAVDTAFAVIDKIIATGKAVVGAVVDWWKKKKEVTTNDGERHTIYLEGSGDNYHLMIRTTPETYRAFIEDTLKKNGIAAPAPGSPEQKALQKADAIDKELQGYGKVKQEDRTAWGEKISGLIDELADLTGQLKINWNVPDPPSIIRWGGPNSDGFGTMMSAELLSENYVKGEPAEEETKAVLGWDYARSFQTISKKGAPTPIYVKGHLLNENLGGPANVTNLTPITNDMNKDHLNRVERHVKKLVLGKESAKDKKPTPKKVVNYAVDVQYAKHPQRSGLVGTYSDMMWKARRDHSDERKKPTPDPAKLSEYRSKDEAAMNILALLTYEENSLTSGFGCQWEQLEYNTTTSKWEPVAGTSKFEQIPHTLPASVEHYKPVFETFKTDIPVA